MNPSPDIFQHAVSFDWEALLPVVFFILYGISQIFGSRKKSDPEETSDDSANQGVDPMERARQIREEIRRKIEQRNRQPSTGDSESPANQPASGAYDPTRPDNRQPQPSHPRSQPQPQPVAKSKPPKRAVVLEKVDPLSSNLPVPEFEKRLKEQRQRLAESRNRQMEAMAQARKMKDQVRVLHRKSLLKPVESTSATIAVASPGRLRREILAGLRDPNSLRKAVLYREILDPPVGMR